MNCMKTYCHHNVINKTYSECIIIYFKNIQFLHIVLYKTIQFERLSKNIDDLFKSIDSSII